MAPRYQPTKEKVVSCTLTRNGEYLIITDRGNSATADEPIRLNRRVKLAGGKARAA